MAADSKNDPPGDDEEGETSPARKAVYVAAAVLAVVLAWQILKGDEPYTVTGEFETASQLVPGNQVIVGGVPAGKVKTIELGDDGQALVEFTVDEEYAPLERGTVATVRSYSLSSVANRQIQLTIPPDGDGGEEIPPGGTLSQSETVSEVDLDQIFNTLDPDTVEDFKHVIQGFEISYDGVSEQANKGFKYLNPFLSTSRRLFSELGYDERALERLIIDGSKLSGALAERAPDISNLIGNLDVMMNAIGRQKLALAEAISKFPNFMRDANTTFVNLRAALDDVDPLVDASKPAALELQRFLPELRAATADAVPTIRDLDAIVRRSGPDNDLVELTNLQVPLARAGVGQGSPECGTNPVSDFEQAQDDDYDQGAFGESVCALRNGNPILGNFRAYTPELVGWFDGFGHSGYLDAMGGLGRISTAFNQFSVSTSVPSAPIIGDLIEPQQQIDDGIVQTDLDERCPGTNERVLPANLSPNGGVPYTDGVICDPDDLLDQP